MTSQSDPKILNSPEAKPVCASVGNNSTHPYCFRFTPAEWRHVLDDPEFLQHDDNRCYAPRMLMGVPVLIIPDRFSTVGPDQF